MLSWYTFTCLALADDRPGSGGAGRQPLAILMIRMAVTPWPLSNRQYNRRMDSELGAAAPETLSAGPSSDSSADVSDDFVLAPDPDWQPADNESCMFASHMLRAA